MMDNALIIRDFTSTTSSDDRFPSHSALPRNRGLTRTFARVSLLRGVFRPHPDAQGARGAGGRIPLGQVRERTGWHRAGTHPNKISRNLG